MDTWKPSTKMEVESLFGKEFSSLHDSPKQQRLLYTLS